MANRKREGGSEMFSWNVAQCATYEYIVTKRQTQLGCSRHRKAIAMALGHLPSDWHEKRKLTQDTVMHGIKISKSLKKHEVD